MEKISNFSINQLREIILNKTVRFISDCELFPNFDVTGKVKNLFMHGNEILITIILKSKRDFTISGNMKNLRFEII